jgi:MFS family permease
MPLTLTLISEAFPTEKRGVAIGLWGGIQGLAVAAGPVVGGAIAGGISWHWIFWLNVPIGLALMPLAARRLSESFGPRPELDVAGLALAAVAAFGVTWALVRADSVGWDSVEIIASLGGGLLLAAVFVGWERRSRTPMLRLELFRDRTFASTNASASSCTRRCSGCCS